MKQFFKNNGVIVASICISTFLFCYIVNRIFELEITHDEAYSFFLVDGIRYKLMAGTANNHWLNSIFIFFETKILGNQPWQFRIHSVLAFIIFSYFLTKIVLQFNHKFLAIATLCIIEFNLYILDFFSLARGYGLGMGFEMGALYYLLVMPRSNKQRVCIYLFLCLAAFSIYTNLYLLLAYILLDLIAEFKNQQYKIVIQKSFLLPYLIPILFLIWAIPNLIVIKKWGDLNEGLDNGFIPDTMGVYIYRNFQHVLSENMAVIIAYLLFSSLCVLLLFLFYKKKQHNIFLLGSLLLTVFFISNFLHLVFHTPFAFGRTSLYFCTALLLFLCMSIDVIKSKLIIYVFSLLGILFFVTYFISYKTNNTTIEWYRNEGVKEALQELEKLEKNNLQNISVGMSYMNHYGVYTNYYNYLHPSTYTFKNLALYKPFEGEHINDTIPTEIFQQDYVLWYNDRTYSNKNKFTILDSFPAMNTLLIRNEK